MNITVTYTYNPETDTMQNRAAAAEYLDWAGEIRRAGFSSDADRNRHYRMLCDARYACDRSNPLPR